MFFLENYLNKLMGKNDLEDALKKLDVLTKDEAQMAIAEVLRVTHGIDDKVTAILDGSQSVIIANEAKIIMQHAANEVKTIVQQATSETKVIVQKATNEAKVMIRRTANEDKANLQQISSNVGGVRG
jgi:YesN/AraC family two-component response regulator